MLMLPNCVCWCGSGFKTPEIRMDSCPFRQISACSSASHKQQAFTYSQNSSNLNFGGGMICGFLQDSRWVSVSGCSQKSRMFCHASSSLRENTVVADVPNLYQVLGLSKDVALPDIKAAYRQMARRYHPDVCAPEEAEECTRRFIALQEAYETLSDPRRKALYDRAMTNHLCSSRGWSLDEENQLNWKLRWEDQLAVLKKRSAVKATESSESWGARMRRQRQQQQQQ